MSKIYPSNGKHISIKYFGEDITSQVEYVGIDPLINGVNCIQTGYKEYLTPPINIEVKLLDGRSFLTNRNNLEMTIYTEEDI